MSRAAGYAVAGAAVAAGFSWIDLLFLRSCCSGRPSPVGPRGGSEPRCAGVAAAWALAGLLIAVSDLIVNQEDVVFHLALAVIIAGLAAAAWYAGRLAGRRWR